MVVQDSLYEQLFPFTTVMKQRMVEHFDGNVLCVDKWCFQIHSGSGSSGVMQATIDGGFIITTGTATNNFSSIHFDCIRQFDPAALVAIFVRKKNTCNTRVMTRMTQSSVGASPCHIGICSSDAACFMTMTTNDGGTTSSTLCETTNNCLITTRMQICCCCATGRINGVLEATHGTNLPTADLAPTFLVQTNNSGSKTAEVHYIEAYNT